MSARLLTIAGFSLAALYVIILTVVGIGVEPGGTGGTVFASAVHSTSPVEDARSGDGGEISPVDLFRAQFDHLKRLDDVMTIDSLQDLYGPVRFSHRRHAEMSQITGGCANCHHEHQPSDADAGCHHCHAPSLSVGTFEPPTLKAAFHRQCLACHRDWAHENACGFCHEERATAGNASPASVVPTPDDDRHHRATFEDTWVYRTNYVQAPTVSFHHADHSMSYGVTCDSCHAGETCGHCHDPTAETRPIDRHTDCMTCHTEKNNCGFCHDQQVRGCLPHKAENGWSLMPYHENVSCRTCHGDPAAFFIPAPNCLGCHQDIQPDSFDHSVTGVTLRGSHVHFPCQRCHTRGDVEAPATCAGCHPSSIRAFIATPGLRTPE
jgi:hypothetical protein